MDCERSALGDGAMTRAISTSLGQIVDQRIDRLDAFRPAAEGVADGQALRDLCPSGPPAAAARRQAGVEPLHAAAMELTYSTTFPPGQSGPGQATRKIPIIDGGERDHTAAS